MLRAKDSASWVQPNDLFPNTNWCLLLPDPDPDPSAVVAVGDGPAASMARARLGTAPEPRVGSLAVGDRLDGETLSALRARLGPGGVAYVEIDTTAARSVRRLRTAFLASGFADVAFYASSPASHRWDVSWWLPIGSSDAVRFVAAARAGRRVSDEATVRSRAVQRGYRALQAMPLAIRARPWLLHPGRPAVLCAVGVVADDRGCADPTPGIAREAVAAPGSSPGPRPTLAVRAGGSSTDQPMAFVFTDGSELPVALVKAPALDEEVAASRHEAAILQDIADTARGVPGVPRLLGGRSGGIVTFAQTFVPGDPVAAVVRPATVAQIAEAMTDWAVRLADATATGVDATWGPTQLDAVLAEVGDVVGADVASRIRAAVAGALSTITFAVTRHCDLGPWNVHLDPDGRIGVIDWADAVPAGVPLADLVHHLLHLELCAEDAYALDTRGAAIRRIVALGPGSVMEQCIDRYVAATGLDPVSVPAIRVLTWLIDLARQEPDERGSSIYLTVLHEELLVSMADRSAN